VIGRGPHSVVGCRVRRGQRGQCLDHVVAEDVDGRQRVVHEVVGVLAESGCRVCAGGGDASDDGEFEYVGFEVAVQRVVFRLAADSLVGAEGADDLDGSVGGLRSSEQVEPARDEDVGDEDVQIGGVAVAVEPGVVVCECSGQAQSFVDQLYTGGTFADTVAVVLTAGSASADERADAGCHRGGLDPVLDTVAQTSGVDVVDCRQCGSSDRSGFLHYPRLATGRAKTFGNVQWVMDAIRTARNRDVLAVTIDRPERRNALTSDALGELANAVAGATAPVLCLAGEGSAFCAGADLDTVDTLDGERAREFARLGQAVADALADYDGATVAAIDGAARGGGVELALACDVRVCTPRSTFAESGVTLGLFGAWGGTGRLVDAVGTSAAMDLSLSGRVLDADEALRTGLVSRVVDDPRTVAEEIADNDADAVRAIKGLLADPADHDRQQERERDAFAELVEARAQKRKD